MDLKRGLINNRGQVTIFIIIAVLVIAFVALFFILRNKPSTNLPSLSIENPSEYVTTCLEDSVGEAIDLILLGGGSIEGKLVGNFEIDGNYKDITYLCYTEKNEFCEILKPSIINTMENELQNHLSSKAEDCFNNFLENLENEGYNYSKNFENFEIDLQDEKMFVNFNISLSYSKGESSFIVDKINLEYSTELYGIGEVVQDILEKESEIGDFDRFDYMTNNPDYSIKKYKLSNSRKIYVIENKNSQEEFWFAVRGGWY